MSSAKQWVRENIPSLEGKVALVTGANSGVGLYTSKFLAMKGAEVILACRNSHRCAEAQARIKAEFPSAVVTTMNLDLSDLSSVRELSDAFPKRWTKLDILCCNAGIMAPPYSKTKDGFELQFGVNHLGHFALTGLLLPQLMGTPGSRVVTVSSGAHKMGNIRFHDPNWEQEYGPFRAYAASKLANILFAYELNRKFELARIDSAALACHPGFADTKFQKRAEKRGDSEFAVAVWGLFRDSVAQPPDQGSLPLVFASAHPEAHGGEYIGPSSFLGLRGTPKIDRSSGRSYDRYLAERLWKLSEKMTGVEFSIDA